ncbi:MAG: D-alanine--D-alanine ligase [Clostridiales bacterium]|jgi:D-alanine-D-alanine ligase|nr:D-alanine--D-alanine ligase [Clostridiales bacterium]MDR2712125.1 D-alanine--D-alanine ligase [Clostridiales bacterium]
MEKITVAIIYGGRSVEHEVSIISALQTLHALDKDKYQPLPLYISKQGRWYTGDDLLDLANYRNLDTLLDNCRQVIFSPTHDQGQIIFLPKKGIFQKMEYQAIDVAFPVIHGTNGEDGCLQGLLELSGLPYVGPGVLGAAAGMDKIMMKACLKEAGLPTPDYTWFYGWRWKNEKEAVLREIEEKLTYPLVIKPANLGSSIGIGRAQNDTQLTCAIDLAATFSGRILVEQAITPLREINCSVLGCPESLEVSVCEEPAAGEGILSFADKYLEGGGKGMSSLSRRIPADLPQEQQQLILDLAKKAFIALDGHGVSRIDFLVQADEGKIYINEINTIPGSLAFYLWQPAGKDFSQLTDELIHLALRRQREKQRLVYTYASNILSKGGLKGAKSK